MRRLKGNPITLQTENYILQSINPEDIPDEIVNWYGDPETMRHMNDTMNLDKNQLSQMFSVFDNKFRIALLARSKIDNAPVGLFRIFVEGRNWRAETSVLVGNKDYWGKNTVIEIRSQIMHFLFTGLRLNKISGNVRARNFPALLNYTKQGFDREGILKKQVRDRDGNFEDVVIFGMLKEKWENKRKAELEKPTNESQN